MSYIQHAIKKAVEFQNLTPEEARAAMMEIMSGSATPAQIASFLTAMRMKGETIEEIASFAKVMRENALKVRPRISGRLIDTCGTGGDVIKTFNVSTVAMFVAAGAGAKVAKHGNRSVTSKAGSADVLEYLGVKLEAGPTEVERCIEKIGVGFMFAPIYHPSMKHAIGPRREMGIRTVFNILGPLCNPADVKGQLLGVFDPSLVEKLCLVLKELGVERAMVVSGIDGLDELSTLGPTKIAELDESRIETYELTPEEVGLDRARASDLEGKDVAENARILVRILKGERGPRRDIVVLNAGAAILVAGLAKDLREGMEKAEEAIDSGRAYEKLLKLVEETGGSLEKVYEVEKCLSRYSPG